MKRNDLIKKNYNDIKGKINDTHFEDPVNYVTRINVANSNKVFKKPQFDAFVESDPKWTPELGKIQEETGKIMSPIKNIVDSRNLTDKLIAAKEELVDKWRGLDYPKPKSPEPEPVILEEAILVKPEDVEIIDPDMELQMEEHKLEEERGLDTEKYKELSRMTSPTKTDKKRVKDKVEPVHWETTGLPDLGDWE